MRVLRMATELRPLDLDLVGKKELSLIQKMKKMKVLAISFLNSNLNAVLLLRREKERPRRKLLPLQRERGKEKLVMLESSIPLWRNRFWISKPNILEFC